jgi:hypothetical protein
MKYYVNVFLVLLIIISIFGLQPFRQTIDAEKTLVEDTGVYATEVRRLPDATYLVAVRTPMPEVKADMVRWWFSDFLQTTEHYNWWHPKDHVWMDWENKMPGENTGSSHLVHEYIGGELAKLRIQFVNPSEFFSYDPNDEDINVAKMCHVVRNTLDGAEMRTRFWLGHVAKREGNKTITSIQGFIGNTALARLFVLDKQSAEDLKRHAKEEMKYLADLLPTLYESEKEVRSQ